MQKYVVIALIKHARINPSENSLQIVFVSFSKERVLVVHKGIGYFKYSFNLQGSCWLY